MALELHMITVDSTDPERLGRWWAQALGGTLEDAGGGHYAVSTAPAGIVLGFQKVDSPTPGKNRLHLDLSSDARAETVAALVAAGAREVYQGEAGPVRWTTLADPDGNLFCISQA
jgi:predicted enzyme related to lactoylglutathione lyase